MYLRFVEYQKENRMIIDYNMSKDYCADWSAIDAIREILQNALDSGQDYECSTTDSIVDIVTKNTVLKPEVFSMGVSDKTENSIGKYGEGFKIAMLVLTRLGHKPVIFTGDYAISGMFRVHEFTGVETFCLNVSEATAYSADTQFLCQLYDIDIEELEHKLPYFSEQPPKKPAKVDIWQKRPGEIYVNGLYVTKTDLVFGYNFAPSQITLNRDRNMVDGVYWQLAQYYADLPVAKAQLIFDLIERDAPDVQDLSYRLHNKELQAELASLFFNKYGDGARIAKPGTSYYGGHGSVSVGYTASRVYSKCGVEEAKQAADPEAPDQILINWKETNKSKLRRDLRESLDKIITRSKGWKKADIF